MLREELKDINALRAKRPAIAKLRARMTRDRLMNTAQCMMQMSPDDGDDDSESGTPE